MKLRIATAFVLLFSAFSLLAANPPVRRTVVIRDGKVITDNTDGLLPPELLGGKRAYLGVSLVDISPDLREYFGTAKDSGVLVESVEDGSPADKAGLRVGDIVTAVDGKEVARSRDLRRALRDKKEGDTARIDIVRGKSRQTVVATLVERDMPRLLAGNFDELRRMLPETFDAPEWRARVLPSANCADLQARIHELESRMKELEKKLQK